MKYLCAYALAWLSGNQKPTKADLEKIISAVGGEFDDSRAKGLCEYLNDKELEEVIKGGLPKLQSVGGGAVSSGGATGGAAAEEKAEEGAPKEEDEDEDALEGGMGLFGDEEDDW